MIFVWFFQYVDISTGGTQGSGGEMLALSKHIKAGTPTVLQVIEFFLYFKIEILS